MTPHVTYLRQFVEAIESAGLTAPTEIIADGKFHRFPPNGRPSDLAGWYVVHLDGIPAGAFGDWRAGKKYKWHAHINRRLTKDERTAHRARIAEMRRQHESEQTKQHDEAREKAEALWNSARAAPDDHPYLKRKGVKARGLRVDHKGRLLVPMTDGGKIHSLQIIEPNGQKWFLPGGRKKGCYFVIGDHRLSKGKPLCIAEGYATAASIHEATNYTVVMAFDCGNLAPVAQTLRELLPDWRLIFCADDDIGTNGNPGLAKATEAARAVDSLVSVPDFGVDRPEGVSDFNDLERHRGLEAVKQAIDAAQPPASEADDASARKECAAERAAIMAEANAPVIASAPEVVRDTQVQDVGEPDGGKGEQVWPELDSAALHGLPGDIVHMIEPHSESDPVAILVQTLVAFGNATGRAAYFQVEADKHYMNLYAVLVGDTSKARKGTSKGQVMSLFDSVDETWRRERVQSGLSSGEGLIWAVRDPIHKRESIKEKKRITGYQDVIADHGVEDKRLLVVEPEFASTLRVQSRETSTLSPTLRNAWDDGHLRILTKNSPAVATNAHVSIIGHITADELRRYLDSTEVANGFANRFLWPCVRRSKCLPEGSHLEIEPAVISRLRGALDFGRKANCISFDSEARAAWHELYPELSAAKPGLLGALTARGEAQAVRLALVYAMLDCSNVIKLAHLWAALAVWEYCAESAAYIFGDRLGDPVADDILAALHRTPKGLTRTQISNLFHRNRDAQQIGRALSLLLRAGRVRTEQIQTDGRPLELWIETKRTKKTKKTN